MDIPKFSSDLGEKLIAILQKLTESNLKLADDVFLEKLLSGTKNELSKNTVKISNFESLISWLKLNTGPWAENPPPSNILAFVIQLMGIFAGNEEIFLHIRDPLLSVHLFNLRSHIYKSSNLKLTYITLLSNAVNHKSGCEWVLKTAAWKEVLDMYLSKPGLFIEREALSVLTKLLENINWDNEILKEILQGILLPIEEYRKEFEMKRVDEKSFEMMEKKLETSIVSFLQAYTVILETWITSTSVNFDRNIMKYSEIEPFWKFLLETSDNEILLEKVSIACTLQLLITNYDLNSLTKVKGIPDSIFEIFKILVKRKKITNIIRLAKYCQLFWNKITLNSPNTENGELESHFIIIQLIPAFLLLKRQKRENCAFETYINKLYDLTTENTQRLGYLLRDVILYGDCENSVDYGFQAVLSVSKNMETLNLNRAVLIFQALAYVLKMFVPRCCDFDDPITDEEFENKRMMCSTKEAFLSSTLNALCVLIEKFKINWTEALESLCLLKFCSVLLDNPNLSPRLGVQTLSLIKLAILNFMAPNLILLVNKIEGTSLECLLPVIYHKLHDPNWEIRDSCVEVIGIMAELAETKYPFFQEVLLEGKYCELMLSMVEGDSESYVRSSALRVISQMIRIESLRNRYFNGIDLISKITNILRKETEGVVRREAALLAKEIFESRNCKCESLTSLFQIMGYAATRDLHWEVKVNALFFWEKVIQRYITDQGMIDGFFPSITFSKDNKKIVSLTGEEIKTRLRKVLNELSNIGCLHVLITTLKDDYDFQVVQKSAQILTDLVDILKRYNLLEKQTTVVPQSEKCSAKRKSSDITFPEKKVSLAVSEMKGIEESETNKSNRIIEDIVNELDLNLLGNVYNPNNISSPQETDENFLLKKIEPESFLNEMQNLNISSFVNAKRKWLLSREDDLNELLNDIQTLSIECETNVLDCY